MKYAIGIDTGGTYTDAVLLDMEKTSADSVRKKAKAITTHHQLEIGVGNSIKGLDLTDAEKAGIEKVVLSTTLATNAIVEKNISNVGVILIGSRPAGEIAAAQIKNVKGQINIKGRIVCDIHEEEALGVIKDLIHDVDAIAVSGAASIRNPVLEKKVKALVQELCQLPVVCGHEIVSELGYLERTNTAALNAGLLSIIARFIEAINHVLEANDIKAPVFVVKGDGSISRLEAIRETPIDTVLSGPASSMIGSINLTGIEDAVIADMGGTTTDTGTIRQKRVELSPDGATVGGWKIRVKSAKLRTFGLGGDSHIRNENGEIRIGPRRVLPACRGGECLTPTDILHYTGEFRQWDSEKAEKTVMAFAAEQGLSPAAYVEEVKKALREKIRTNILEHVDQSLPICAIGAPAETWYKIVNQTLGFDLVIPAHYEVANAVGAAAAGIQEMVETIIRVGEDGHGYLVHTKEGRFSFHNRIEAIQKAIEETQRIAANGIIRQNLVLSEVELEGQEVYNYKNQLVYQPLLIENNQLKHYEEKNAAHTYIEARIRAYASGNIFES